MSQEEVRWGTRVSSCILGWWKGGGGLRLGIISLTTYPKQLFGPTHPPPGTGPYSPLGPPVPSLSSSNFCKVVPYMELKTASVSTELPGQSCRDSREGPRAPCSPFCLGLASPLGCGLGTLYLLSAGPFLEHVTSTLPVQEIQLPLEPMQGLENTCSYPPPLYPFTGPLAPG